MEENPQPQKTRVITIYAFSFLKGIPTEATAPDAAIIDCRELPNTWGERNLRNVRGTDTRILDRLVTQSPLQVNYIQDQAMDAVRKQRANSVFFGCSYGRHRSVAMATEFSKRLAASNKTE